MVNNESGQLMLIINPISGTGNKKGVARMVEQRFAALGFDVDVRMTGGRGDATRLAREAVDNGYRGVLACGGDGTVNETATALCGSSTALGILPAGSGNGLARHLGIPVDVESAIGIVASDNVVACDYGTVNEHAFRPQTYTLSANGKILTEKAFLVAVCNASQWGNNAYIAPQASITDGLLDIILVHSGSPIDAAVMGMDIFTGFSKDGINWDISDMANCRCMRPRQTIHSRL